MSDALNEILAKRRDRAIAIILACKEREIDPLLNGDPAGRYASAKLRKVVLDQVNDLHDLCGDILNSLANDSSIVINEHWLNLLAEIHEVVINGNAVAHAQSTS